MTETTDNDDMLAAEYVLGTLDADERVSASTRIETEAAFATLVAAWSRRLDPLSDRVGADARPGDLWPSLLKRMGWAEAPSHAVILSFEKRVRRWRATAAAAGALAAGLAVLTLIAFSGRADAPPSTLVAVLQPTEATPAYLVRANLADRLLTVRPLSATPPPGRVYELWIIDPTLGAPRSLGVLAQDAPPRALPPGIRADVAARATYAITAEPPGGSPTGQPSGTPVFTGHLVPT